ncbi:MAG: hypothetical protein ABSB35_14335 [Bryobacteraceae bacterium]|jgi:hypothetical protein
MNAIASPTAAHSALRDEYRAALQIWSEARVLYAQDSPEVAEATRHMEEVEQRLKDFRDSIEPALADPI